jgi:stage II sporulation protein D
LACSAKHEEADFCDLTHCQYYRGLGGDKSPTKIYEDVDRLYLARKEKPIEVFFHSTSGGYLFDESLWSDHSAVFREDRYGTFDLSGDSPYGAWQADLPLAEVLGLLQEKLGVLPQTISPIENAVDTSVSIQFSTNRLRMGKDEFRLMLNQKWGWNLLKSNLFTMTIENGHLLFFGRGLGHGVGLSQYGNLALARQGFRCEEILRFYFPSLHLEVH